MSRTMDRELMGTALKVAQLATPFRIGFSNILEVLNTQSINSDARKDASASEFESVRRQI